MSSHDTLNTQENRLPSESNKPRPAENHDSRRDDSSSQQILIPDTFAQMTPFVLVSVFHNLATRPALNLPASPFYVLN